MVLARRFGSLAEPAKSGRRRRIRYKRTVESADTFAKQGGIKPLASYSDGGANPLAFAGVAYGWCSCTPGPCLSRSDASIAIRGGFDSKAADFPNGKSGGFFRFIRILRTSPLQDLLLQVRKIRMIPFLPLRTLRSGSPAVAASSASRPCGRPPAWIPCRRPVPDRSRPCSTG